MDYRSNIAPLLGLWIVGLAFFGCAVRPSIMDPSPWYLMSSGAHETVQGRAFYGIGQAEGSPNMTLLRATAVNRARNELAKVLDGYVAELFQATQTMPALTMEDGEQVIGALVRSAMTRSVVSDHWKNPENGRLYALCRLDLESFKQVLANHAAIDSDVRSVMAAEAEKVHDMMVTLPR